MTPRVWAAVSLAVLAVAIMIMALVTVPWHSPPAPRQDQIAALRELPADAVARGRAFHSDLRPSSYASMAVGLVLALVLGLTPAGARLIAWCGRPFGGHWIAEALLGGLTLMVVSTAITLPLSAWRQVILRRYGLSTQGWGGWTVDLLKGLAVSVVLGGLALLGFYALTRYVPRWWWAWGAAAAAGLVVLLSFVFPVLVEPIFNKFTPMPPGQLRTELIAMADRDGVPVKDVLVADASRRTRGVNAYVSGYGATRRIVVYDTLLSRASPADVESVVAHELGHAKDNDVLTGTALGALGAAAGVVAVYLLGFWTGLAHRAGLDPLSTGGTDSVAGPRGLALLLAVAAVAGLVSGPAQNLVTRKIEARADGHALALTGDPAAFESMQGQLSVLNLADPDPNRLEYLMFATHPSTVERMAAARAYARSHR